MDRLAKYVPDKFAAAQILHYCVTPRIGHVLRALPPTVTLTYAADFDSACIRCFTAIAAPDFTATGLPPFAEGKLRLKLRDGGLDIATQARTAPAAYVASWATARRLILRLCPSIAPFLPADFSRHPAPVGAPGPILQLHAAIATLPADAREALSDYHSAALAADAAAADAAAVAADAAAAAAAADDDPLAPAATPEPAAPADPKVHLQRLLSRPSHDQFTADFVTSIAANRPDSAKHLSQTGYLGTVWFKRRNLHGHYHLDTRQFLLGAALHLSLPVAAFEGCLCGCGVRLTAAVGPFHIAGCSQFAKLERSETLQHAFDSIIYDVTSTAWIEGARRADGKQKRCAPYASVPVVDRQGQPVFESGHPKLRDIIPDRVAGGVLDGKIGASGRYIIDTAIPAPECKTYSDGPAATTALSAANAYHALKLRTYQGVMRPGDVLLPVVCESWGGLHPSVQSQLSAWARYGGGFSEEDPDVASSDVLSIWRMRLSVALLHARIGYVDSALRKLRGVPTRSLTLAHSISHPYPYRNPRALESGRLGVR